MHLVTIAYRIAVYVILMNMSCLQVWKWWEEQEQLPDGVKWRFLEHKGPMLAPEYDPLPSHVK